jgi:hypothetical protein
MITKNRFIIPLHLDFQIASGTTSSQTEILATYKFSGDSGDLQSDLSLQHLFRGENAWL